MTDTISKEKRSWNMAQIRSKNTQPEVAVRSWLHRTGFRFRIHRRDLPGSPDIVLSRYHIVIFVNGCFWHQHHKCKYATMPKTNNRYWNEKLKRNVSRDRKNHAKLKSTGWRVLTLWECVINNNFSKIEEKLRSKLS